MQRMRVWLIGVAVMALVASDVAAQYAYPAAGQSPAKQAKDEVECGDWARAETGFDPANPPPVAVAQPAPATGSGARVRGAAVGATVGAIGGGDVGDAALAGVVVGGVARRSANRRAAATQNQAAAQQAATSTAGYVQAKGACLTGRGYTVK